MNQTDKGLIKKVIKKYCDSRLSIVTKFINQVDGVYDETEFLDDGFISREIKKLKQEHAKLLQQTDATNENLKEDLQRLANVKYELAFYASNSLAFLDNCMSFLEGINTPFKECLMGLQSYKIGKEDEAYFQLNHYYNTKKNILNHYMVNKVYGELLYKRGKYEEAIPYLIMAVEKRPEALEVHVMLRELYVILDKQAEKAVAGSVIKLLEG